MSSNPFDEREPFKKRVLTVSVSADQMTAFTELQKAMGTPTVGATIKALIGAEIDRRATEHRKTTEFE